MSCKNFPSSSRSGPRFPRDRKQNDRDRKQNETPPFRFFDEHQETPNSNLMLAYLSHPTRQRSYAGTKCSSLVKLELNYVPTHIQGYSVPDCGYKPSDVGFVFTSHVGRAIIWAQSWFLYDPDSYRKGIRSVEGLRRSKVSVIRQDQENYGRSYDGVVTWVDFDFHLAVIVVSDPKWIPVVKNPPILDTTWIPVEDKTLVSLDFDSVRNAYTVKPYTIEEDVDDEAPIHPECRPFYHVDWHSMNAPGVLLNSKHNIVGFKFGICPLAAPLKKAHVLPVKEIVARLREKSNGGYHDTDIRQRYSNDIDMHDRAAVVKIQEKMEELMASSSIDMALPYISSYGFNKRDLEVYRIRAETAERRNEDLFTQVQVQGNELLISKQPIDAMCAGGLPLTYPC